MGENTLYRQVSFEDGFDLISNGNDDKFIYLKEVPEQEQEEVWKEFYSTIRQHITLTGAGEVKKAMQSYHLIKK